MDYFNIAAQIFRISGAQDFTVIIVAFLLAIIFFIEFNKIISGFSAFSKVIASLIALFLIMILMLTGFLGVIAILLCKMFGFVGALLVVLFFFVGSYTLEYMIIKKIKVGKRKEEEENKEATSVMLKEIGKEIFKK